MTALLEKAISHAASMSEEEQNRVAEMILHGIDAKDDQHWDRQFADSQDVLAVLADEAWADYEAGRTTLISA